MLKSTAVTLAAYVLLLLGLLAVVFQPEAGILLVVLGITAYILANPLNITYGFKEKESKGCVSSGKGNALLLVSFDRISSCAQKGRFSELDFSLYWINTLYQELGGCEVVDISKLTAPVLALKSLVVVSSSASAKLKKREGIMLEKFEGPIIIEMPSSREAARFCAVTPQHITKPSRITSAKNAEFLSTPLNTRLLECEFKGRPLLEMDGKPAAFLNGNKLVLLFDFAMAVASLEQGTPNDDYSISKKYGLKRYFPSNLMPSKELANSEIPFAGVLEKTIFNWISRNELLPRVWYYPNDFDGAAIMTHDEDYYGDASLFLFDYERSQKVKSIFLPLPDSYISSEALKQAGEKSFLGLHWNRYPVPSPFFGVKWLHPTRKKIPLHNQVKVLEKKLGLPLKFKSCRIHGLVWGKDYVEPFRILQANGFKTDSSYGSNLREKGYISGTGFPFRPIDKNGLLFDLFEYPHTIADYPIFPRGLAKTRSEKSAEKYHEVITGLYHPVHVASNPEIEKAWKGFFNVMRENKHWLTNWREFNEWLAVRSRLQIRFSKKTISWSNAPANAALVLHANFNVTARNKRKVKILDEDYFVIPLNSASGSISLKN